MWNLESPYVRKGYGGEKLHPVMGWSYQKETIVLVKYQNKEKSTRLPVGRSAPVQRTGQIGQRVGAQGPRHFFKNAFFYQYLLFRSKKSPTINTKKQNRNYNSKKIL